MAGDWIKMRTDLDGDPAVIRVACEMDMDTDTVIGKLHRLWSWADKHTRDGNAVGVTSSWLNGYMGADGFAESLERAGWLVCSDAGLTIPKFDTHNGKSAKTRAISNKRVETHRKRKCNADVTQGAYPEKRREESNTTPTPSSRFTPPTVDEVRAYCAERGNDIDAEEFIAHYEANGWKRGKTRIADWKACVRTWEKSRTNGTAPRPSARTPQTQDEIVAAYWAARTPEAIARYRP